MAPLARWESLLRQAPQALAEHSGALFSGADCALCACRASGPAPRPLEVAAVPREPPCRWVERALAVRLAVETLEAHWRRLCAGSRGRRLPENVRVLRWPSSRERCCRSSGPARSRGSGFRARTVATPSARTHQKLAKRSIHGGHYGPFPSRRSGAVARRAAARPAVGW